MVLPPNNRACLTPIVLKENPEQGGGQDPLTSGTYHVPKGVYVYNYTHASIYMDEQVIKNMHVQ